MSSAELVHTLHLVSYLALSIALVSTPFLVYNWIQYTAAKRIERDSGGVIVARSFPTKSVGFFLCSVLTGIICVWIIIHFATNATVTFLNSLSGDYSVRINGVNAENPDLVVAELKKVGSIMAHHSHPTDTIRVEIDSSNGKLVLDLRRDSDSPNEYWVFNPAYDDMNEIGRITTRIFDRY